MRSQDSQSCPIRLLLSNLQIISVRTTLQLRSWLEELLHRGLTLAQRQIHKQIPSGKPRRPQVFFLITAALIATAAIKTYGDRGCHAVRTCSSLRLRWTSPSPQTTNIPSAISVVGTEVLPLFCSSFLVCLHHLSSNKFIWVCFLWSIQFKKTDQWNLIYTDTVCLTPCYCHNHQSCF